MRSRRELVAILLVALISVIVLGVWMIYAPRGLTPIDLTRIEYDYNARGLYGDYFEPGVHVVATDSDLLPLKGNYTVANEYWDMLISNVTEEASEDKFITLVISHGREPTGGYDIQITSASISSEGVIEVHANFTEPSPGVPVTQAFTYPVAIIPLGNLPVGEYEVSLVIYLYVYDVVGGVEQWTYVRTETQTISFKIT